MICLYLASYSIEHVLLFKGLSSLSLRVCVSFPWGHFSLWVTFIMHSECRRFMWEFYEILCFLDHGRYVLGMRDEWPFTRVSNHCLIHHSIIGDMTFLYCTDIGWSSFIPLSHYFILYPITSFQICLTPFIHFLILTHFWFDTFYTSFTHFIDSLNTYPFFLFHHRHFPWLPLVHGSRVLLYMSYFIHKGMCFLLLGIWA